MKSLRPGRKLTIVRTGGVFDTKPPSSFLRCRMVRRLSNGWQLYDPVRDYSYGVPDSLAGRRVVVIA